MPVVQAPIEAEFTKNKELKREDLDKLREWLSKQPHIPEITDLQLILFLHSCYYSNEATKSCIDNYYTARALCPEFFANRDPNSAELRAAYKNACLVRLEKPTNEGYTIAYGKLIDFKAENFVLLAHIKTADMLVSLVNNQEGTRPGFVLVLDAHGMTLGHVLRINPLVVKKYLFFLQEALPIRLLGFHFINCIPLIDKVVAIIKPFMKKELFDMLKFHQPNSDSIYDYVPKECFLDEQGGKAGPAKVVQAEQIENLIDNTEYFLNEEKFIADETKRQGRPKNAGDLFGVEGTFKKLDLD